MNDMAIRENIMDLAQDMLPVIVSNSVPSVDILDRQAIVEQIFSLLKTLSDAHSSCAFALNGKWGSGKTFLLNMLEPKLRDYKAGERFMVFHYNCWQYDYYDEPLIAIVSAMLDNMDEYVHILSDEVMEKVRIGISAAKSILKKIACSFIENKIGFDANCFSELIDEVKETASSEVEDRHKYDKYYAFHKVIMGAREELSKLAEDQTLVVVVDELDRCLPDYSIKVLERLHHMFAGLKNTVLIMSVDKTQLEHTVKTTFGEGTDCDAYLRKFIDFELEVDTGTVNDNFLKKYSDYIALFDEEALEPWPEFNDYIAALFSGIEIRRQEHLVKKIHTIHRLLFNADEKKDYSFLCFELFMAVLSESSDTVQSAPLHYKEANPRLQGYSDYMLWIDKTVPATLIAYIKEHWIYRMGICQTPNGNYPFYSGELDIPLLLIGYSELTYGENGILNHDLAHKYDAYINDFKAIKQMLEIIK